MNEINGVQASNLVSTKPLEGTDVTEKEEVEKELFAAQSEEDGSVLDEIVGNLSKEQLSALDDKIKALLGKEDDEGFIQTGINNLVEDLKNFDVEEAHVYAEGEAAIAKEVERRVKMQMIQTGIAIKFKSEKEIEAEVRAEYSKEHPEYAAVRFEGQMVEAKYDAAKEKEMSNWEKENPKPKRSKSGILFGGIFGELKYQMELKEWKAAKAEHEKSFENNYAKENPNYANLKEQREEQENKFVSIKDLITGSAGSIIKKEF